MTQVENHPVRWCPNPECGEPSTLSEDVWEEIERDGPVADPKDRKVVCGECLETSPLWSKERTR